MTRTKCEYPACDCESRLGYCEVNGVYFAEDEPVLPPFSLKDKIKNIFRPGLGMIVILWQKLFGGGRR